MDLVLLAQNTQLLNHLLLLLGHVLSHLLDLLLHELLLLLLVFIFLDVVVDLLEQLLPFTMLCLLEPLKQCQVVLSARFVQYLFVEELLLLLQLHLDKRFLLRLVLIVESSFQCFMAIMVHA